MEEEGGPNIYGALQNDPIQRIDRLGLQFGPRLQFGFRIPLSPGSKSHIQEAETTFVAKSFIAGLPELGNINRLGLGSFIGPVPLAPQSRLTLFSYIVSDLFELKAFHETANSDAKNGEYRLYTRVKILASCEACKLHVSTQTDSEGGRELPLLYGTISMNSSITYTTTSSAEVRWTGFGRPNLILEPGMQFVGFRSSVNIWHDVTVVVSCDNGKPVFALDNTKASSFPSFRLWQDGIQIDQRDQGPFSDLWHSGDSDAFMVNE